MRRIMLSVEECDVFQIPCDILALKYAQAHFGVDAMIVKELLKKSPEILDILPQPGKSIVLEASPNAAAAKLLFVGVKPLRDFNYGEIRDFSRQVLTDAAFKVPQAAHVVFTLHGAGYGMVWMRQRHSNPKLPELSMHLKMVFSPPHLSGYRLSRFVLTG